MNFTGLVIAVLSSVLILSGCSKGSNGNSSALKDVFFHALESEPADLNPLRSNEGVMYQIITQHTYYASSVVESLLAKDLDTYEHIPNLASKWKISEDGKEFTFFLRKGVKFHDGSEMTSKDVKFSFDAIFKDLYEAYVKRSYYSNFESADIIDDYTIKFKAKTPYLLNLEVLGGLLIIPEKVYSKQSKDNRMAKTVVGTGPYRLKSWNKGKGITLETFTDWWGRSVDGMKDRYKFKKIVFKFVKESSLRRAMLERGKLDFDVRVRSEDFVKKMDGDMWGKSVLKVKAKNKVPKNLSYIGWNNNHPILSDKKVRKALAYFINTKFILERFYYGLSEPASGPFRIAGEYANPKVKPIPFNPAEGQKILKNAGWSDTDKDGVLDKVINGKKSNLEFTLISASKDTEKTLTVIKEDMKKAGVNMIINIVDWNALMKAVDERKFDATIMSWGGGYVDPDPTQIWHSKSSKGAGSNYISYSNPEVDALIEKGIKILDKKERIKVYHKIHELIADDAPYAFLWEQKYQLYAVSARTDRSKDTYNYSIGPQYWSLSK